MEKIRKNDTASLLMVVGIIFIVVAGTIFVSTAWRYLPTAGKQGILFLGMVFLFLGAGRLAGNPKMKKTETALYYLGTSCLGLFTLSVCGEWLSIEGSLSSFQQIIGWNTKAILVAGIVMLPPVVLRFAKKRTAFDFVMMALLADWVLFWVQVVGGYGWLGACIISGMGLTAYALADYLRDQWMRGNGRMELAFIVLYILHAINFIVHDVTLSWAGDVFTSRLGLFMMALFMTGITELILLTRNYPIFRVFNSLSIYWSIITGVNLLQKILRDQNLYLWDGEWQHFCAFTLCAICMIYFARKEMLVVTAVWGGLLPFAQILVYGDYDIIFCHIDHKVMPYIPFTGILVLAFGFLLVQKYRDGSLGREQAVRYLRALSMQGIIMLVLFYASKYPFYEKGIYSLLLLQSLAVAFLFQNPVGNRCFKTAALFFGEILLGLSMDSAISVNYGVEQFCFLVAIGVFLIGVIWDQYGYLIKTFQFVCICLLMLILLANTLLVGNVENALILGGVGAIMLCFSAIGNSRRYVVLSSVVLIILAFYVTRSFWSSIAWWVYLFAAGVVLVILAVHKEKKMGKQ